MFGKSGPTCPCPRGPRLTLVSVALVGISRREPSPLAAPVSCPLCLSEAVALLVPFQGLGTFLHPQFGSSSELLRKPIPICGTSTTLCKLR